MAIDYKSESGRYSVYRTSFYCGLKKHSLLSCVRKQELPFHLIDIVVRNWDEIKENIINEVSIYKNFEP